jgi:hypothetical protein
MFSWWCCSTKPLAVTEPEIQLSLKTIKQYSSNILNSSIKRIPSHSLAQNLQNTICNDDEQWFTCQFHPDVQLTNVFNTTKSKSESCLNTDSLNAALHTNQNLQLSDQSSKQGQEDWWAEADSERVQGCTSLAKPAKLVRAKVVKFDITASEQQLLSLYDELGAHAPTGSYVAVWLKLNDVSLVLLSELPDGMASQVVGYPDLVMGRLKLILNPVKVKLPLPAKGPKDADTVGSFFGKGATLTGLTKASSGADIAFIQIDLYSKWMMRLALQRVGFRLENTLELLLVDWPGQCVLSSIRLMVTQHFLDSLV